MPSRLSGPEGRVSNWNGTSLSLRSIGRRFTNQGPIKNPQLFLQDYVTTPVNTIDSYTFLSYYTSSQAFQLDFTPDLRLKLFLPSFPRSSSDLQIVLDQIRSVSRQRQQHALSAVVPNNAAGALRVLEHEAQLRMADPQREKGSERPIDVFPV